MEPCLWPLSTPEPIKDRSLTSLKETLVKIGAKVVSDERDVAYRLADVAIPTHLFAHVRPNFATESRKFGRALHQTG